MHLALLLARTALGIIVSAVPLGVVVLTIRVVASYEELSASDSNGSSQKNNHFIAPGSRMLVSNADTQVQPSECDFKDAQFNSGFVRHTRGVL